jgi:DNA oxidative demethylase
MSKDTFPQPVKKVVKGKEVIELPGMALIRNLLQEDDLSLIRRDIQAGSECCPFYVPTTKSGTPFRYEMTCFGPQKWLSDQYGYRYEPNCMSNGKPMYVPNSFKDAVTLALWWVGVKGPAGKSPQMQTYLVNHYNTETSRLGMHQDKDEEDLESPIVSLNDGAAADFVFKEPSTGISYTFRLEQGDALIMYGSGRMAFHGVQKVYGSSRINITARQVKTQEIDLTFSGERLPSLKRAVQEQKQRRAMKESQEVHQSSVTNPIVLRIANASNLAAEGKKTGSICDRGHMVCVSRSEWVSKLGIEWRYELRNQYTIYMFNGQRGPSITAFEDHFCAALAGQTWINGRTAPTKTKKVMDGEAIRKATDSLLKRCEQQKKLILVCHCAPLPCHCNVIVTYLTYVLERHGHTVDLLPADREMAAQFSKIAQIAQQCGTINSQNKCTESASKIAKL